MSELEESVRLEPGEALYWNNLGAAFRMAGRPDDSLGAIDEAVRLDPRAPEPYYNRGLTLESLGRTEEARRQYLLALELDPLNDPRAYEKGEEFYFFAFLFLYQSVIFSRVVRKY